MFNLTPIETSILDSGNSYVYVYCNPTTGVPFYVGKGTKDRCLGHIKRAVNGHVDQHNKIKSKMLDDILLSAMLPIIKILVVGDSSYCCAIERKLIAIYGRRCDKTGCLSNIAEGGEGGENGGITKANIVLEAKYGPNYRNIIIANGREVLKAKYGPNFFSAITKMGAAAQKIAYGDKYTEEMIRRSTLGNSESSLQKKRDTYVQKHGSLQAAYASGQVLRKSTLNKRGWSVKCYDLESGEVKIVKKDEFRSSPNLVGMSSKRIPPAIRQQTVKKEN